MEAIYFMLTRRPRLAGRRLSPGAVSVRVAGFDVPTYYHRVGDLRAAAGGELRLTRVEGLGVVIPPPYLEARWQAIPPRLRALISRVDGALSTWPPFNRVGDHVLLHFVKEPAAHD
jgi:hypothetical protein